MNEKIIGPFDGRYIACYACPMGDTGQQYLAIARICSVKIRSFWAAEGDFEELCDDTLLDSGEAALAYAEQLARAELGARPGRRFGRQAFRSAMPGLQAETY